MPSNWEPGTQYNLGDEVFFEGRVYKIIQPHFSQSDWTPPVTPALWGLVPYCEGGRDHGEEAHYRPPPQYQAPSQEPWANTHKQEVPVEPEERKKNWWDLAPDRKKELEIGGGLAAGLALLGAGYVAYEHHEKTEEEKKAAVWGLQNWLNDAQARTQRYFDNGPSDQPSWILVHGTNIPENAIQGGVVNDNPLYISRAFVDNSIQVGKCASDFTKGAVVGYKNKELEFDTYEVLVGSQDALQWVEVQGQLNLGRLGISPVEGGREADGTALYIAQAPAHGGTHCGKISEKLRSALIPANGKEVECETYNVLCYNN